MVVVLRQTCLLNIDLVQKVFPAVACCACMKMQGAVKAFVADALFCCMHLLRCFTVCADKGAVSAD